MKEIGFKTSISEIRNIIDKISDGMAILDMNGIVKFINPAAEFFIGRKAEKILGNRIGFEITTNQPIEVDLVNMGGEPVTVEVRMVEIDWEKSTAYLASFRDITDRKTMEEELRSTYQQVLDQQKILIEEERLKVVLQMAGATVHELSQPLTVLLGNLDMLETATNDSEEFNLSVNEIKKAGKSIADIIQKIQSVRHYESKPYYEHISIINIDQEISILVVEDSDADFLKLSCILENYGKIKLARAKTLKEANAVLAQGNYDLIVLDYILPDGNGLDFVKSMHEKEINIPIVVITGQGNEVIASQFVKAGVYDYLPKANVSEKSVARVISNALEKFHLKQEMDRAIQKMAEMATRDELTDLYNRKYFMDVLEREVASAKRYEKDLSVCMIDLDGLKKINDTYGCAAGDSILKEFANIIKKSIRKSDLLCRYGSEKFAIILTCTDGEKAQLFGERIRKKVETHPFKYNNLKLNITISIGISCYSKTADTTVNALLDEADRALNQAKSSGENRVSVFS